MKSRTYGLDARPNETNADDEINFSHAAVRLLPAEVLLDAICQVLERARAVRPIAPRRSGPSRCPGPRPGGSFLKTFGKPDRLLTCECERSESTTLAQAFQLINGEAIRSKLDAEDNRIGRLIRSGATDAAILDELTLAALGHEFDATRRARVPRPRRQGPRPPEGLGRRGLGDPEQQGIPAAALSEWSVSACSRQKSVQTADRLPSEKLQRTTP